MITEAELSRATNNVYGSSIESWSHKLPEISGYMAQFPPVTEGKRVPLVTFLIFAKKQVRLDNAKFFSAIFSEKNATAFMQELPIMAEHAKVQASVDAKNFESEYKAFGDLESAITKPHLDISPVYRYAAAVQYGLLFTISEQLLTFAIRQLRANPFLYFAYGEDYIDLLPIPWEGL